MTKKQLFTTAPKSLDIVEDESTKVVGKHRIGYPVRVTEVPEAKFYDAVKSYWLGGHMAVLPDEFQEMVSRGLIEVSL